MVKAESRYSTIDDIDCQPSHELGTKLFFQNTACRKDPWAKLNSLRILLVKRASVCCNEQESRVINDPPCRLSM